MSCIVHPLSRSSRIRIRRHRRIDRRFRPALIVASARRSSSLRLRPGNRSTDSFFGCFTYRYRSFLDPRRKSDPHARAEGLVAGGNEAGITAAVRDRRLLGWVQRRSRNVRRLGSVCSGTFILAAAGLLDGRTVATNWSAVARLASFRPGLTVDGNAIFVREGRVWTSAGITTGIDMSLAMVEEDCGRRVADRVAAQLVLHARRPGFQSQFSDLLAAQARRDDPLSGVLAWAAAHLTAVDVETFAQRAAVSLRTLHRLCARTLGTTPAKLIERMRTDRARVLLGTTGLSAKEIAAQCGFRDAPQLTRSFARSFGVSPRGYRLVRGDPCGTERSA